MINIYDNYYVDADENQYVLYVCGRREKMTLGNKQPTGEFKDYQEAIGYYTSLTGVLSGCIQHATRKKVANNEISHLRECIEFISDIEEKILDATKGY